MKKLAVILFLLTIVSAVYAQNAVIREITGTVELQRAGSSTWTAARAGDRIEADTVISSGFRSTAIIAVGSSTLTIHPITRLTLKELVTQNETETINVNLNTGRVRVEVAPPAGSRASFTVQSPSAVASVRGTSFEMDTAGLWVLTGAVTYTPSDQSSRSVIVNAGQGSQVDIITNTLIHPMIVAEIERALPPLQGQEAGTVSENSGIAGVTPNVVTIVTWGQP